MDIIFPKRFDGDLDENEWEAVLEPTPMGKLYNGLNSGTAKSFLTINKAIPWTHEYTALYLRRLGAGIQWPMPRVIGGDGSEASGIVTQWKTESIDAWQLLATLFCRSGDVLLSRLQGLGDEELRRMLDTAWDRTRRQPPYRDLLRQCSLPEKAHEDWRLWSCHTRGYRLVRPDDEKPECTPVHIPVYSFTPPSTQRVKTFTAFNRFCAQNRLVFQIPGLNVEFLKDREVLRAFIASRALHEPAEFVTKDWDAMHIGRTGRLLQAPYHDGCFLSFREPLADPLLGTRTFHDGDDLFTEYPRTLRNPHVNLDLKTRAQHGMGRVMGWSDGLLVLQAQGAIARFCTEVLVLAMEVQGAPSGLPPVPPAWPVRIMGMPRGEDEYMDQAATRDKDLWSKSDLRKFCNSPRDWYRRVWSHLESQHESPKEPWKFQLTGDRCYDPGPNNELFLDSHNRLKGLTNSMLRDPKVFRSMVRDQMTLNHHYGWVTDNPDADEGLGAGDGPQDEPNIYDAEDEEVAVADGGDEDEIMADGDGDAEGVAEGVADGNDEGDDEILHPGLLPHLSNRNIDAKRALANDAIRRCLKMLFFGLEIFWSLHQMWNGLHTRGQFGHPASEEYIQFVCILRRSTYILFTLLTQGGFLHSLPALRQLCCREKMERDWESLWELPRASFNAVIPPRVLPRTPLLNQPVDGDTGQVFEDKDEEAEARLLQTIQRVLFTVDQGPPSTNFGVPSMVEVARAIHEDMESINKQYNEEGGEEISPLLTFLTGVIPRMLMLDRLLSHSISFADHRIHFHEPWSQKIDEVRDEKFGHFMKTFDEFPFEDNIKTGCIADIHLLLGIKYANDPRTELSNTDARSIIQKFRTLLLTWMDSSHPSHGYRAQSISEKTNRNQRGGEVDISGNSSSFQIGEYCGRITTEDPEIHTRDFMQPIVRRGPRNMTGVVAPRRRLQGPVDNAAADYSGQSQKLRKQDWALIDDFWGRKSQQRVLLPDVSSTFCRMGFSWRKGKGSEVQVGWSEVLRLPKPANKRANITRHAQHLPGIGWHFEGQRKRNFAKAIAAAFGFTHESLLEIYEFWGPQPTAESVQVLPPTPPRKQHRRSRSAAEKRKPSNEPGLVRSYGKRRAESSGDEAENERWLHRERVKRVRFR